MIAVFAQIARLIPREIVNSIARKYKEIATARGLTHGRISCHGCWLCWQISIPCVTYVTICEGCRGASNTSVLHVRFRVMH